MMNKIKNLMNFFIVLAISTQFTFAEAASSKTRVDIYNKMRFAVKNLDNLVKKEIAKDSRYKAEYVGMLRSLKSGECEITTKKDLTMKYTCGEKFIVTKILPGKSYFLFAGAKMQYSVLKDTEKFIKKAQKILKANEKKVSIFERISDLIVPKAHANGWIWGGLLALAAVVAFAGGGGRKSSSGGGGVTNPGPGTTPVPEVDPNNPNGQIVGKFPSNTANKRWVYIDDMVQSLSGDVGGDTNAPQDWLGAIFAGAHYNELPVFMGVTATLPRGATHNGAPTKSLVVAKDLSMGIPVFRGNDKHRSRAESDLSRKIVQLSKDGKGALKLVVGGPLTDVYVALTTGADLSKITVFCIGEWNRDQDTQAYDGVKSRLGSRFQCYHGNREYLSLIQSTAIADKEAWIRSLYPLSKEWEKVHTEGKDASGLGFVLRRNRQLNAGYRGNSKGFRMADIMVTVRAFQGTGPARDLNHVTNMLKRGATLIRDKR